MRWVLGIGIGTFAVLVVLFVVAPTTLVTLAPGPTFDVLGDAGGQPTLRLTGAATFPTTGELRMTTVSVSSSVSMVGSIS